MDQADRDFLQKFIVEFKLSMVDVLGLVDYLYGQDILSESMKDEIMSYKTRSEQVSALHMLIPKRGKHALEAYHKALEHTKNCELGDLIKEHIKRRTMMPRKNVPNAAVTDPEKCQEPFHGQNILLKKTSETKEEESKRAEKKESGKDGVSPDVSKLSASQLPGQVQRCDVSESGRIKPANDDLTVYSMEFSAKGQVRIQVAIQQL